MLYTDEQKEYFYEIALNAEYGDNSNKTKKWQMDPKIKTYGNPTDEDLGTLDKVIDELNNGLIHDGVALQLAASNANVDIHFVPEAEFGDIEPRYVQGNKGFFWVWWNSYLINRARILISTTGVTQIERSHLIREELTQSLGLMNDSYKYTDSIFYQGWTDTETYADIDKAVIQILYDPNILPNKSYLELKDIVDTLQRPAGPTPTPPTIPTNLQATAISSSQIDLSWNASTDNVGVTGYSIYRDGTQIATTVGTTYQDTGLSPSTTYTYTVSAYDAAGNVSAPSTTVAAATSASVDTTPPAPPSGLNIV